MINCQTDLLREDLLSYMDAAASEIGLLKSVQLSPQAAALITTSPNAFLFGLIADQSVKAETAWSLPWLLQQRLGHLDVQQIADMEIADFEGHFKKKTCPAPLSGTDCRKHQKCLPHPAEPVRGKCGKYLEKSACRADRGKAQGICRSRGKKGCPGGNDSLPRLWHSFQ